MQKKLIACLCAAVALGGCASFPEDYEKNMTMPEVVDHLPDGWNTIPALSYSPSKAGTVVQRFNDIPAELAARPISLKVTPGTFLSLNELLQALRFKGVRVVSRLSAGDTQSAWLGASFSGTVGELIQEISQAENISYEYRNGTLFLMDSARYAATLPPHKDFLVAISKSMEELGATEVRADTQSGTVFYRAKPDVAVYVKDYLEKVASTAAMVNLQVVVLTVGLHKDRALGFDWAALGTQTGRGDMAPGVTGGTGTGLGNLTPTAIVGGVAGAVGGAVAGAAGGAAADKAAVALGRVLGFSGSEGFAYHYRNKTFSLSAAMKALSSYGNARTEQNVLIGTLSGMPVMIKSGNDIPYVKSVGSATASGGATTGSTTTEIIQSGLKVEVTPNYEAEDGAVVTTVKVELSSLVGFRELSAGTNLGTLSQPEMQKLEFSNSGRITVGDTVVMGGITYDQLTNNYNNLPGAEKLPTGSKAEKVTRNAIYIVLRPTVVQFADVNRLVAVSEELAKAKALKDQRKAAAQQSFQEGVAAKQLPPAPAEQAEQAEAKEGAL